MSNQLWLLIITRDKEQPMKNSQQLRWIKYLALTFVLFSVPATASLFSNVYIFGDSLSDTGNTAQATGNLLGGPVGYGNNRRFSNGILWHEYLSNELELPTTSSAFGGNNYAYGGAELNNAGGFSSGLLTQYDQYLGRLDGDPFDSDALYIAWAGGNDMRGLVRTADPFVAIANVISVFQGLLSDMIYRGVTTLLVPNLPNLGSIPEFRTTVNAANANLVSVTWNQLLEQMLIDLAKQSSAQIYMLNVFDTFTDILNDPQSEGFTNTTGQCRSLIFGFIERSCSQANQFVFWDNIHPTTAAHAVLGREAALLLQSGQTVYQQIPEPATITLFLLASIWFFRRRREM
jgi:phospholipase/lecithinase/hemolysin